MSYTCEGFGLLENIACTKYAVKVSEPIVMCIYVVLKVPVAVVPQPVAIGDKKRYFAKTKSKSLPFFY